MLVNGGGAVTLQFQRSPFKALTRTSYIPWNQIHVIEPVVMASSGGVGISWAEEDTSLKLSYSEPCLPHHFDKMKPLLFSSHQPSRSQNRSRGKKGKWIVGTVNNQFKLWIISVPTAYVPMTVKWRK